MNPHLPPPQSPLARRVPFAAFSFVVLALGALALAPTLVLERVAATRDDITSTLLPAYDRMRVLALAMERQAVAVRGYILSGDSRYRAQFAEARAAEVEALDELEALAPRLGDAAVRYREELQAVAERQYAQNIALMQAGPEAYRGALPRREPADQQRRKDRERAQPE